MVEYIAPAPAVSCVALAPAMYTALVPVLEYIVPAPAVSIAAPAPVVIELPVPKVEVIAPTPKPEVFLFRDKIVKLERDSTELLTIDVPSASVHHSARQRITPF